MKLVRTFHPVGHGAFYTELVAGDVVNVLFISHFHTDHINGIDYLMKHCNVKKVILPAIDTLTVFEALVYTGQTDYQISRKGWLEAQELQR